MYHYIRDFQKTNYPKIKGLDVKSFENQIKYLTSKFNILNPFEIRKTIEEEKSFSNKDCWLTFDDGYIDHYEYALPILNKYNIKGTFFPPIISTIHNDILDPSKIHFILASIKDNVNIVNYIKDAYLKICKENDENSFQLIINSINTDDRFDDSNTILIKSLLQKSLRRKDRNKIMNDLFKDYVTDDMITFSKKLYMNISHIKELHENGHEIGLHGYNHNWLGTLSSSSQKDDIMGALNFWKKNNIIKDKFTMCYPYGDYNSDTLKILSETDCVSALTSALGPDPTIDYLAHELPRYDTNDFPK